jgi:Ino eighty subunit 2
METINKLLKKQAPKTNRKAQIGMESTPDIDAQKPSPIFVRWVSNKNGMCVAVPDEIMAGPAGRVFVKS